MASKQNLCHVFDDRYRCAICGKRARAVVFELEQQLAQARALLQEELPYEERSGGYHAEEWSARVRTFLAHQEQP